MPVFDPLVFDPAVYDSGVLFDPSVFDPAVFNTTPTSGIPLSSFAPTRTTDVLVPVGVTAFLDRNIETLHLTVEGTLQLGGGFTLDPYANFIVRGQGRLTILPDPRATVTMHVPSETAMIGGGLVPLEPDVGMWVEDNAQLTLAGSFITGKVRLAGSATAGSSIITIDRVPIGWRVGGRITIAPTGPSTDQDHYLRFDERVIQAISGTFVTLTVPLQWDHPIIDPGGMHITAAVLYLERDIVIQGQPGLRSHLFMRSTVPQFLDNIKFDYFGPRRADPNSTTVPYDSGHVLGRWGTHFHHGMMGSIGSRVQGCLSQHGGSWSFVAHMSDGVTFRDCHVYDAVDGPFRWDFREPDDTQSVSNGVLYDSCTAAKITGVWAANLVSGFPMQAGSGNACTNCEVVGITGFDANGAAWQEFMTDAWTFSDFLAYCNQGFGIRNWKNDDRLHTIQRVRLAYNRQIVSPGNTPMQGIMHGAYLNAFQMQTGNLYGNCLVFLAASDVDHRQLWQDYTVDMAGIGPDAVVASHDYGVQNFVYVPTVLRRFTVRGYTRSGFHVEGPPDFPFSNPVMDLIGWTFGANEFWIDTNAHTSTQIRIQDSTGPGLVTGDVFLIRQRDQPGTFNAAWNASVTRIARFA